MGKLGWIGAILAVLGLILLAPFPNGGSTLLCVVGIILLGIDDIMNLRA